MRPARRSSLAAVGLAVVALATTPAAADERPPALTLARAVEIALAQSPLLVAAGHEVRAADAGVDRARAGYLPRLDVGESWARSDNPVYAFGARLNQGRFRASDFDIDRLNAPGATTNFRTSVTLTQPLWTGGRTTLGIETARLGRTAVALGADRQRHEVMFAVAEAYYGLLLAQANRDVVSAGLRAAEANRERARARFETGVVVESDLLSAEVRLAGLQEQQIATESRIVLARAALNDVMGRPLDEPVDASEALAERPWPAAASAPAADALERRPDHRRVIEEERAAERHVALARAEFLPTLSAKGSYDVDRLDPVAHGQDSWFLGVALQWNLFNGLADRARVTEARATLDRARALRARAASTTQLEVTDARLALRSATERIGVARRAIVQAEESLRLVQDRYGAGLVTIVDLLTVEEALTRSRASLTRALYDENVAAARLELAAGTIGPGSFR